MSPELAAGDRIGAYRVLRSLGERHLLVAGASSDAPQRCELYLVSLPDGGIERVGPRLEQYRALTHAAGRRLVDGFEHEGELALVFEAAEGLLLERLQSYLDRDGARLPQGARWLIGWQIMGVLAQAHLARDAAGRLAPLVHGCVNPNSVLITWDGEVRLLGLCPWLDVAAEMSARATPARVWLAPEVRRGDEPTAKSDAFGAAMVTRNLLTGRPPPARGASFQPLGRLCPEVPSDVATALDRALDVAPRLRPSCAELAQRFEGLVQQHEARDALREAIELYRALSGLWTTAAPPLAVAAPTDRAADGAAAGVERWPGAATEAAGQAAVEHPMGGDGRGGASEGDLADQREQEPNDDAPRTSRSPGAPTEEAGPDEPAPPSAPSPAAPVQPAPQALAAPPAEAAPSSPWRAGPSAAPGLERRAARGDRAPLGGWLPWLAFGALAVVAALFAWHRRGDVAPTPVASAGDFAGPPGDDRGGGAAHSSPARGGEPTASTAIGAAVQRAPGPSVGLTAAGSATPPLLSYEGYLLVRSGVDATVYVKGRPVGRTNQPNKTRCQPRFVRIGLPPGPRWISEGRTVNVPCGGRVEITMEPDPDLMPLE